MDLSKDSRKVDLKTEETGLDLNISSVGNAFVEYASKSTGRNICIGQGLTPVVLSAVLQGANVVYINADPIRRNSMQESLHESLRSNLVFAASMDAVLLLNTEPISSAFISTDAFDKENEQLVQNIYHILVPGGEIFLEIRGQQPQEDTVRDKFERAGYIIKVIRGTDVEASYVDSIEGRLNLIAVKPFANPIRYEKTHWSLVAEVEPWMVPTALNKMLFQDISVSDALKNLYTPSALDSHLKYLYSDEVLCLGNEDALTGYVWDKYWGGTDRLLYSRLCIPTKAYVANKSIFYRALLPSHVDKVITTKVEKTFEIKSVTLNDELLFDTLIPNQQFKELVERNGKVPELWARRTRFVMNGHMLLFTEVFLGRD